MGQKMDPRGLRVGVINDWNSRWYADAKHFGDYVVEDKFVKINVFTAKPGIVIGKGGNLSEQLKAEVEKLINKQINLNIIEVKDVDVNAQLVAENIAAQLERRISFRRAMKQCMQRTMRAGALGIKTACSGRLGGADMARTEFYKEGTVPLQTLRADIDYGFAEANTTYGKVGVKVWIYKGEILPSKTKKVEGGNSNAIDAKKD